MLSFPVFARFHLRRPLVARRFTLPVNVLTDRCPRTIEAPVVERISRQPRAYQGVGLACSKPFPYLVASLLHFAALSSLNPLSATFTRLPAQVLQTKDLRAA